MEEQSRVLIFLQLAFGSSVFLLVDTYCTVHIYTALLGKAADKQLPLFKNYHANSGDAATSRKEGIKTQNITVHIFAVFKNLLVFSGEKFLSSIL
jgi:hypothetical protein